MNGWYLWYVGPYVYICLIKKRLGAADLRPRLHNNPCGVGINSNEIILAEPSGLQSDSWPPARGITRTAFKCRRTHPYGVPWILDIAARIGVHAERRTTESGPYVHFEKPLESCLALFGRAKRGRESFRLDRSVLPASQLSLSLGERPRGRSVELEPQASGGAALPGPPESANSSRRVALRLRSWPPPGGRVEGCFAVGSNPQPSSTQGKDLLSASSPRDPGPRAEPGQHRRGHRPSATLATPEGPAGRLDGIELDGVTRSGTAFSPGTRAGCPSGGTSRQPTRCRRNA